MTHRISQNKLLHSKWTALFPVGKEKHFVIVKILDPKNHRCQIEAIMTGKRYILDWHALQDKSNWKAGWL